MTLVKKKRSGIRGHTVGQSCIGGRKFSWDQRTCTKVGICVGNFANLRRPCKREDLAGTFAVTIQNPPSEMSSTLPSRLLLFALPGSAGSSLPRKLALAE